MDSMFDLKYFWALVVLCGVAILPCNNAAAQIPNNKASIDSLVVMCQNKLEMRLDTDDDLVTFFQTFGVGTKKMTCVNNMSIVMETKLSADTVFAKLFYSFGKELIYLKERHFIYRKNQAVDTLQNKKFKIGYAAYYYIVDNFYADGNMSYSYEFRDYNYSPEPITYVLKMIKQNEQYLKSK